MSDYATFLDARTVRFERLLPGPIERVWDYLTDSQKRGEWLATGPMELKVGGRAELTWHHADLSPHKEPIPERFKKFENGHTLVMKITRCDPPRLLSLYWGDNPTEPSEVTFELTNEDPNVRLVLTHRRLLTRESLLSVSGGWHTHLGILLDRLNGRMPPSFWSSHAEMVGQYETRLPAE